jgi:hypothetical protein
MTMLGSARVINGCPQGSWRMKREAGNGKRGEERREVL